MTEKTVEKEIDETLEAVAHERSSSKLEDELGHSGVAQIRGFSHCRLEDVPRAHQARFTRRSYLPDEVENLTDEFIQEARASHEGPDMPSLLQEDGFLEVRLSYGEFEFSVYRERGSNTLDKIASYCNVDDPANLVGCGVPVRRRNDTYQLWLSDSQKSRFTFEGSVAGSFAQGEPLGFLMVWVAIGAGLGAFFAGVMAAGVSVLLAPFAAVGAFLLGVFGFYYGWKAVMYALAAFYVFRNEGELWPSGLYARNFDGWRDYLFG